MTDSMKGLIPKIKADIEELFNTLENLEVDRVDALEDRIAALEANSPALTVVQGQGQQRDNVAQATPKVLPTSPAILQGDVHVDDEILAYGEQKLSYRMHRGDVPPWEAIQGVEELENRLEAMYALIGHKRSVDLDNVIAIIENEADSWEREGCYAHVEALSVLTKVLNEAYKDVSGPGPKQDQ